MSFPPFSLTNSRFDEETYFGRLQQIVVQFDPLKLLKSESDVKAALDLLEAYKANNLPPNVTDKQLWEAKELIQCVAHPDDMVPIFKPFCFAAYAPMQPMIAMGMLWPNAGTLNQMFWQWYNQSYNSMVWYYNKNKSNPLSDSEVAVAYVASTATAMGLAYSVMKLGAVMSRRGGTVGGAVVKIAPFVASVGAGWMSLLLMRKDEILQGVNIRDSSGTVYGKSKNAGKEGLAKCAAARVVWNIPIFAITPFALSAYQRSRVHARFPRLFLPFQIASVVVMTTAGIYPAQALFRQTAEIPASRLEPQFQNIPGVSTFYFNKGL